MQRLLALIAGRVADRNRIGIEVGIGAGVVRSGLYANRQIVPHLGTCVWIASGFVGNRIVIRPCVPGDQTSERMVQWSGKEPA